MKSEEGPTRPAELYFESESLQKSKITELTVDRFLLFSHRGIHPFLRWQHVHEGGDANNHAHWGWGCFTAVPLPEGLRFAYGYDIPRLGRHTQDRVGRGPCKTHGQLRYRMLPPPLHPHPCIHPSVFTNEMAYNWFLTSFLSFFLSFLQFLL